MKLITTDYLTSGAIYLTCTEEVEREFVQILNNYKDAFWEEDALQFMKDIDTAKRQGDYGVVTDFGESCITCLSTGCKFGLLVLYLTRKFPETKVVVKYSAAGGNVWDWLSRLDITLYLLKEHKSVAFLNHGGLTLEHEGIVYSAGNRLDFWDMTIEEERAFYTLTTETENSAYEAYKKSMQKKILCSPKEELSFYDFIKRFPDGEETGAAEQRGTRAHNQSA